MRKNSVKVDLKLLKELDYILPKLKYSISNQKIIRWLENFEEKDQKNALEFLFFLEYIDNADMTFRLNEILVLLNKMIPLDHQIIIYPGVTSYPKSVEVVNYIIKDTPIFKKYKANDRFIITRDLEKVIEHDKLYTIVLVDDFIGTGRSFKKSYDPDLKFFLDTRSLIKDRYLIAAICMVEAKEFIKKEYPEIKIYSEFREKVFHPHNSPFELNRSTRTMQDIANKYGITIPVIKPPRLYAPLGFGNSESLIVFNHTTPNNTLPLIWGAGNKWFPIFPRFGADKLKQAKELKTEMAFFIGFMNRIGLDLYTNQDVHLKKGKLRPYNCIEDHSLLCILKLQIDGYEMPAICQFLGITQKEYGAIIRKGTNDGLISRSTKIISPKGRDFFQKLTSKIRTKRFLKRDKLEFEIKNITYVPKIFNGKA